ncbi:amylo-alpha-1,6-glucosidase, partial [uncultured Muribaculum sp.]|uniref:amylo-alpha-1,6-glucosidase n=1 Tax=uncultured Muribaculum sp. TaxID=1918613 RepID=UPI0025B64A39
LMFTYNISEGIKAYEERREHWGTIAEQAKTAFVDTFLNDHGYLYDYVNGHYADLSVRPNIAIAIGLDYSPLDRRQRKGVLDVVTRELLTPKGLRTLSPKSYGYQPFYLGSPEERERAYHNGPARPWLMGSYADAYIKVFGMSGVSYIDRMLIGFEEEMSNGCIGTISQLYDGNPPFTGRGAISQATNVAEVLRTLRNLKKLNM